MASSGVNGRTYVYMRGDPQSIIAGMSNVNDLAMRRAMRHTVYSARLLLQAFMRQGSNGANKLPDITSLQSTRYLDKVKGKHIRGSYPRAWKKKYGFSRLGNGGWHMFGKLIQTIRYKADVKSKNFVAQLGWFDKSSARLAAFFQKGQKIRITKQMRGLFWAAGIGFREGKEYVEIPERQVITPFFNKWRPWMMRKFNNRYSENIYKQAAKVIARAEMIGKAM